MRVPAIRTTCRHLRSTAVVAVLALAVGCGGFTDPSVSIVQEVPEATRTEAARLDEALATDLERIDADLRAAEAAVEALEAALAEGGDGQPGPDRTGSTPVSPTVDAARSAASGVFGTFARAFDPGIARAIGDVVGGWVDDFNRSAVGEELAPIAAEVRTSVAAAARRAAGGLSISTLEPAVAGPAADHLERLADLLDDPRSDVLTSIERFETEAAAPIAADLTAQIDTLDELFELLESHPLTTGPRLAAALAGRVDDSIAEATGKGTLDALRGAHTTLDAARGTAVRFLLG